MVNQGNEMSHQSSERMQCMEVWGGNCEVNNSIEMPGINAWVYSEPFGNSSGGGDVYYITSCASGRITRILLADVSGHGETVSNLALGLRELMRRNVNVVKQSRFVEGMNRQFQELSQCGSFATAVVATFFQPTQRLTFCNAGHPDPLFFSKAKQSWSQIEQPAADTEGVAGTPLGVHDQAHYPQIEQVMDPGDLVLFYSDALIEAATADGRQLGSDGLLTLVRQLGTATPKELLTRLLTAIRAVPGDGGQIQDDLTIVLLQASGTSTRLSDNLLALFRLFRPVADRTRLR